MCVFTDFSMPVKTGLSQLNGRSGRRTPGPTRPPGILHIRKNTKIKVSPLTGLQMEKKNMFFVIPEMPSKTFVIVLKKLPDHFNSEGFAFNMYYILLYLM